MKILVEIHHGLGDVVQMIPLFQRLREAYMDAEIAAIVATKEHAQILKLTGLVNDFFYLNMRKMSIGDYIKFIRSIRNIRFELGIIAPMTSERAGNLLMHLLGCKRILAPIKNEEFYSSNSVMQGLNILKQININSEMISPQMFCTKELEEKAKTLLDKEVLNCNRNIGVCVGTGLVKRKRGRHIESVNAKCILPKVSMELVNALTQQDYNVFLLGGAEEKFKFEQYKSDFNDKVYSFLGGTSIFESIALLNKCQLVIGGDTGLIHIADAIGVDTLVYYAASSPKVGPFSGKTNKVTAGLKCQYCYGSSRLFECEERKCLNYVTSDLLISEVEKIMYKNSRGKV